jgi:hypothetical protein
MFGFLIIGSLSPGRIVRVNHFLSIGSKHFNMSSKRKEYKVNDRAKKAALFGLACEANPATRLSIPAAMRAKGYLDVDAMDRILIQQVRRESQKIRKLSSSGDSGRDCNAGSVKQNKCGGVGACKDITNSGGFFCCLGGGDLQPTHQEQIEKQNRQKQKAVHTQAQTRATTLVA